MSARPRGDEALEAAEEVVMIETMQPMDSRQSDVVLRTLRRTRQIREFTDEPVDDSAIRAILEVARWTGSGANRQPWTFVIAAELTIGSTTRRPELITAVIVCAEADVTVSIADTNMAAHAACAGPRLSQSNDIVHPPTFGPGPFTVHAMSYRRNG